MVKPRLDGRGFAVVAAGGTSILCFRHTFLHTATTSGETQLPALTRYQATTRRRSTP